jgi:penicillin-binding protein 1A
VVKTAHRLGITSDLQPNPSIALGTSEVSPLELAVAYAPFANGGLGVQTHIITRVKTTGGKLLYQRKGSGFGRVIEAPYVGMMNTMLQETLLTGTARKADLPGWQAAGKTGTSQDWRDAWFVGYTSALLTDVWVGNDDGTPTRKASGGSLPVEIWSRFMRTALKATAPVPLPGNVPTTPAASPPAPASAAPLPPSGAPGIPVAANGPAGAANRGVAPPTTLSQFISSTLNPGRPAAAPVSVASRAPMTINAAGKAIAPSRVQAPQDDPNALVPPAAIPSRQANQMPSDDRNLLQKLFGG